MDKQLILDKRHDNITKQTGKWSAILPLLLGQILQNGQGIANYRQRKYHSADKTKRPQP